METDRIRIGGQGEEGKQQRKPSEHAPSRKAFISSSTDKHTHTHTHTHTAEGREHLSVGIYICVCL